jgi:DnaJ domain
MTRQTRTRDWADVDFYRVLGLGADASEGDVGRAFRTLAKQLHPDAGAPPAEVERFKDVVAAYEVLGDPRVRCDYDAVRAQVVVTAPRTAAPPTPTPPRIGVFRTAKPAKGWTRGRAWMAILGGSVVTLLGVAVAILVLELRTHAGDPGTVSDPARDITLAIVALKLLVSGPVFVVLGALRLRGTEFRASLFGPRPTPRNLA